MKLIDNINETKSKLITFYLFNILHTLIIICCCSYVLRKKINFSFYYNYCTLSVVADVVFCFRLQVIQQLFFIFFINISCIVAYRTPGVVQFMLKQTLLVSIATNGFFFHEYFFLFCSFRNLYFILSCCCTIRILNIIPFCFGFKQLNNKNYALFDGRNNIV